MTATQAGGRDPAGVGPSAVELLRTNGPFRRLYLAQLLSQGGDWFAIVPLLGLLLELSGGPLWGALVLTADTVVIAAVSPWAGTLVDRLDRRRLMVACDLVSAGCVVLLLLVRTERTAFVALVAIGGVAAAKAFFTPSATAAVPTLVARDSLLTATVISGAIWAVMLIVGSSLSAIVTALVGPYWCFVIDAGSFLCSAGLVGGISELSGESRARVDGLRVRVLTDIAATFRIARRDHRIAVLIGAKPGTALANGILAVFPVLAVTVFDVGPGGVGVLFAARGVGALLGPLVARKFIVNPGRARPVIAVSIVLFGVGYGLFPVAHWFPLAAALVGVAHMGGSAAASISTYGLQLAAELSVRGRVMSSDFMVQTLVIGCSQLAVVGLASLVGNGPAITAAAGCSLVYGLIWWHAARALHGLGATGGNNHRM